MAVRGRALIATVRLNMAVKEGKDALSNIRFFGDEAAFSIGYKAVRHRMRGGVRELLDVDLYEVSPVLFGAHPDARVYTRVKAGRPAGLETKAAPLTASVPHSTRRRWALQCSICGLPTALTDKPLPAGASLICGQCGDEFGRLVDPFDLSESEASEPVDGDRPERVTAEDAYDQAVDDEVEYGVDAVGQLMRRGQRGDDRWRP